MLRRSFVTLALGAALAACAPAGQVQLSRGTTLILLRHADRSGDQLSDKGLARAAALVAALEGVGIDRIYSPGLDRNLATAAPLAEARGLEITRIPPTGVAQRILSESAGQTVVWVGNKGNLITLWEDLKAPGEPPLEYGDLFVVTLENGAARDVRRLHFGD